MFHWLKLYGKPKRHATPQTEDISGQVDTLLKQAKSASPAIFKASNAQKAARTAKLEHLAPFVALATLKMDPTQTRNLLEELFDRLDISLREAGVGEMKVGVEIRTYAAAINGRLKRYQPLMEARNWPALTAALAEHGVETTVAQKLQKNLAETPQLR